MSRSMLAYVLITPWLLAGLLITGAEPARSENPVQHRVPDGFVIEAVAGEQQVRFPMFAAFDDRGRLFVAESSGLDLYAEISAQTRKCRISLLEDRDGDGRFESSRVFADKLVFPMGLVWRAGKLYVADPPDLVTLEDTDSDDRADKRTVILTGFGHKDNGSLHGLIFGPDGWLYMTMGSPDGYKLKRADGSMLEGESGALLRCRPDGSEPEVLCRGFENLVEVAFTPRGEVFGTDNWFRNVNEKGSDGLRDALVHLVEGALYPYHRDMGTPQPVTGEPLGPVALFPAVALSGLMQYRGSMFPAEIGGNLFSAQHNARKVGRHVLVADGATFRSQDFDFVTSDDPDFHPSDVLEAADGSLLVIDTGSWYVHHCPTGQIRKTGAVGGIYRVRRKGSRPLGDPWGLKEDWQGASLEGLTALLGDARPAVRDRAQQALAARGKAAVPVLATVLSRPAGVTSRQHAIWALTAIADDTSLGPLRQALSDPDSDIAATAARALAVRKDREAAPILCRRLAAEAPAIRLAAADALARCSDASSLSALWQALEGQPDRFLEHALIHAIHRLGDAVALEAALRQPHPRVQKAALLLLGQPPRPRDRLSHEMVMTRVAAADAELQQTAVRILQQHPEWAGAALGLLRNWLEKPSLSSEEQRALHGTLLAFQGQPTVQELVASALARRKIPADRRVWMLEALAQSSLSKLPQSWIKAVAQAIDEADPAIRTQAVQTAAVWQVPQLDEPLARLAENPKEAVGLRVEALRAVVARRPKLSAGAFELLMGQLKEQAGPLDRLGAAQVLGRSQLSEAQLRQVLQAVRDDALVSPAVLLPAFQRAVSPETAIAWLDYLGEAIRHGWRPTDQEMNKLLQPLPAPVQAKGKALRELLRQSVEQQQARLAEFESLLQGGNPERGRAVFLGNKVGCAACHRIGNEGGQVGPDLTRAGTVRSGRDLLESIVLPSATFAQGYESYVVATADGRVATGVIARRTPDTLILREASGAELRLSKDSIEAMNRQATSLMPEGLPRAMTRDEFRDLLAFLQSRK